MITARSKNDRVSQVTQLIGGTNKHFPNASQQLVFGGATHTASALTQLFQSFVDLRSAVVASQATTKAKVANERAQATSLLAVIDEYVAFVRATFGKQPDVLADFGLAPPKARTPRTAEQKAVAAAKRKATREARHTMGKKQRKVVKGAVNATLVVTPAPVSPPTVVPAPIPSGSSPGGSSTPRAT
jgi:hypothetical protein